MMSVEPIASGEEFANALTDVCNRYMNRLEPSAGPQAYAVTMMVTGQLLSIHFRKDPRSMPFDLIASEQNATAEPFDGRTY
jgi:hypothetical protein